MPIFWAPDSFTIRLLFRFERASSPAVEDPRQVRVTNGMPYAYCKRHSGAERITNEQIRDLASLQSALSAVEAEDTKAARETLHKEVQERLGSSA